jgi:hypothetical protein
MPARDRPRYDWQGRRGLEPAITGRTPAAAFGHATRASALNTGPLFGAIALLPKGDNKRLLLERSANYVLIPDSFKALSTIAVHEDDGSIGLTEHAYDLVIALLIAGTWHSWKKAGRRQQDTIG